MSTIKLSPPNAILFVFDVTNKDVNVPQYIDGRLVASNNTCISIGTQAPVDGETTVSLEKRLQDVATHGPHRVFEGRVECPGRKIAVTTSELKTVLTWDLEDTSAQVEIWVDDLHNPARVAVVAR
jgi:hypothetical protein